MHGVSGRASFHLSMVTSRGAHRQTFRGQAQGWRLAVEGIRGRFAAGPFLWKVPESLIDPISSRAREQHAAHIVDAALSILSALLDMRL